MSKEVGGLIKNLSSALAAPTGPKGSRKRKAQSQPNQRQAKRQKRTGSDLSSAPVSLGYVQPPVGMKSAAPSRPGGEVRFTGCDYIGSLSAGVSSSDNAYALTPAIAGTFPRLEAVSTIFGKYAWNKLKFYVIGKAASTLAGDMTSVPVYDGTAGGGALNESQVKNRSGQVTSKFWENHVMAVDCKKATVPWFNTDSSAVVGGTYTDVSVFGWYHIFLEAVASAAAVADVFVEYDIEFCEAKQTSDND